MTILVVHSGALAHNLHIVDFFLNPDLDLNYKRRIESHQNLIFKVNFLFNKSRNDLSLGLLHMTEASLCFTVLYKCIHTKLYVKTEGFMIAYKLSALV